METQFVRVMLVASLAVFSVNTIAQEQKPATNVQQPSGGGARATDASFRVVRSVSGTKISEQVGRYVVEDPRTVFYAPDDRQVVVYFTWEGPAGKHHFEGLWKDPAGKIAMSSEFDYHSNEPRFGGYFRMLLGDAPATGMWTLEARINGETAGAHTFQITNSARPENVTSTPARRFLAASEIYNRAAAASVLIENINQKGARRNVGTGFFIGPGRLLTAFQVIDDAAKVRVVGAQGQRMEVTEVVAWNRRQDWVILKVALDNVPGLQRAAADSSAIGDRAYLLDMPTEGNRVLIETSLIGKHSLGAAGNRLNIGDTVNRRAVGSPVLNEYGEVIGFIGGNLIPGAAFIEDLGFGARSNLLGMTRGTLTVPMNLVDESAGSSTTISGLASSGQFMPALVSSQAVLHGTLARSVNKKANPPNPVEEKIEFSKADSKGVLFLTWLPVEKRKGRPALRLYDSDNRLITEEVNKKKITVTPTKLLYSTWDLDFAALSPGIYRLDVLMEQDIVWRMFFRMVE